MQTIEIVYTLQPWFLSRWHGEYDDMTTPPPLASIETRDTPEDSVYQSIYDAIQDHRLPPGTKLKEIPLAEVFGVSRAAVRKALSRLGGMKLVELRPNRGAVVASPSIEESRDLFAARRVIESSVAESLARGATKADVRRLTTLVRQEEAAYRDGEIRRGLKLSVDFHRVLAAMAGNRVLAELLDQLVSRTPLIVLAYQHPAQKVACANAEHADLVAAIAAGDSARAVEVMNCHLCALENQLRFHDESAVADLVEIFRGGRA